MTLLARSKNWQIYPQIPEEINIALQDYPKYLRQILFNRGKIDPFSAGEFLNANSSAADPFLLSDMRKTVDRLFFAIDHQEGIVIYGDYDVDGVSATALMVMVLQKYGANVTRHIPNRFEDGYGLNIESITSLAGSGNKLILTVDCGIRSPREAEHAKKLGVDLLISDHHHPKDELPDAFAVICPKQQGDIYPYKELAGVGLAYKIAQALFSERPINGWQAEDWLDLVALGTVADIVPLDGENRMLVRRGINLIRQGKRIGIRALAGVAGKDISQTTASDIGFILGPRLNAAGRMESALASFDLLMTDSTEKAGLLAQELDNQNADRQKMTKEAQEKAIERIGKENHVNLISAYFKVPHEQETEIALNGFIPGEEKYPGIVGLVAAKLTEHFYRPAIAGVVEKEFVRASCRSIPEFHITQALDECADLLVRHGGHAMAAGFTVCIDKVNLLMERLTEIADRELGQKDLRQTLKADLEIQPDEIVPTIYKDLEKLQPTGMGNPAAQFVMRNVKISDMRLMGKENTHIRFTIVGCPINQAVAFNQAQWFPIWKEQKPAFDLFFTIEVNRFFDKETLQINIKDMRVSE